MAFSLDGRGWLAPVDAGRREWLRALCSRAETLGMRVALVGGFVRDRLLGTTPDDFDLVIEGDATMLSRDLEATLGGHLRVHRPFGTATWQAPDRHTFDLASARHEHYTAPAALPTVRLGASLEQDLARRDFTINAMALPLTRDGVGELVDPANGRADLAARAIRVLHPQSFVDDPTRLFRAVRYAARYGFSLTPETNARVPSGIAHVPDLSGDRIRHELELIAVEPMASAAMTSLAQAGVLTAVHPALDWTSADTAVWPTLESIWQWLVDAGDDSVSYHDLALAALLTLALGGLTRAADDARGALARLNPNAQVAHAVTQVLAVPPDQTPPDRTSTIVDQLDALSPLGALTLAVTHAHWREAVLRYRETWNSIRPRTTGDDLVRIGLAPGPRFRALLLGLRAALLNGEIGPDQEGDWIERALEEDRP